MINHEVCVCDSADGADSPLRIRQAGNQLLSVVPLPGRRRTRISIAISADLTCSPALMSPIRVAKLDASRSADTAHAGGCGEVNLAQPVE